MSVGRLPAKSAFSLELLAALGVGLAAFAAYLKTLAPTVLTNDAGRFQIAAPLLGTGHPTGYPTFILVGKLFTYLPVGDVAYRMNLMAAFFGALAAALFFLAARELGGQVLLAASAALVLAFSSTFWSQATIAEVYTMNAAFLLAVAYLLLLWRRKRDGRFLLASSLLYGISLGNNASMVLLAPAYLLLVMGGRRSELSAGLFARAAGLAVLGLSVYLYVPVRGFSGAWHNYGDPARTPGEVWRLISAARFQGQMGKPPLEMWDTLRTLYWQALVEQGGHFAGWALAIVLVVAYAAGSWIMLRRDRAVGAFLILGFGAELLYALSYRIDDVAVYYIPTYIFLALGASVGLSALVRKIPSSIHIALIGAALAVAGMIFWSNYAASDRSNYYAQRSRSEALLRKLPPHAVVYGKLPIIPATYLVRVEGEREDVTLRWLDKATEREHLPGDIASGRPVYLISDPRYNQSYLETAHSYARPEMEGNLIHLVPNN